MFWHSCSRLQQLFLSGELVLGYLAPGELVLEDGDRILARALLRGAGCRGLRLFGAALLAIVEGDV